MNNLTLSTDLNIIAAEVNNYKQTLGKAAFQIGKLQLGETATLKEIAELASIQLGLPYGLILNSMLSVEGGVFNE